jgi:fatty acid desaturase
MGCIYSEQKEFYWDDLIGFSVPLAMFLFGGQSYTISAALTVLYVWLKIIIVASIFYSINAINTGHQGTKIVHEGDEFTSLDFGLYQIGATIDRIEANSNTFTAISFFGYHTLHHMFPTIDNALLPQLYAEFLETCKEFEVKIEKITSIQGIVEQFKQLSRTEIIKVN